MVNNARAALTAFIWTLLGVALVTCMMVSAYLMPLFMGGVLALLAYPLHRRLCAWRITAKGRRIGPRLSALMLTCTVLFLVVGPLLVFATLAVRQGLALAEFIGQSQAFSFTNLKALVQSWEPLGEVISRQDLTSQMKGAFQSGLKAGSMIVLALAKSLPLGILNLILASLTCYFLLIDGPRFLRWMYARLPLSADVRGRLTSAFRDTAVSTVWASMAAALAQALVMSLAFFVLQVPAVFLAGGLTFVLAFIPFAGSVPVWGLAIAYLLSQGSMGRAAAMLAFGIVTATIDNLVRPWVLKGRSEMHPLVSLIAIIGGIETFGIFGAFLGPILAALLISLLQLWPEVGRRYGLSFDTGVEPPRQIVLTPQAPPVDKGA